jgi:hypothetical protein
VYSGRSSYAEYSSIQQAIYGQAVKPTELQTQKWRRLHNHSLAEPRFCLSRDPVRVTQAAGALAAFVAAFCNWHAMVATTL